MSYCAVSIKTESGDDYVFLIEYRTYTDITKRIFDALGEECAYIYTWDIDTGISFEEDQAVGAAIGAAVRQALNIIEGEDE